MCYLAKNFFRNWTPQYKTRFETFLPENTFKIGENLFNL